jgi:hypothetical protein
MAPVGVLNRCWLYVESMLNRCWLYVEYMLNTCWVCVEFMWIICRNYVDYMSNRCWIDVGYIQSRIEAKQWTLELCLSYMVTPAGAHLRDDRPLVHSSFVLPGWCRSDQLQVREDSWTSSWHNTWDLWAGSVSTSTLGLGTLAFTWLSSCDCVESHAIASQKPAETLIVGNCCMNPSVCTFWLWGHSS